MRRKLNNVINSDIIKDDIEFKTQNKKIIAKNQRYTNMKVQNTERRKPSFIKIIDRKYRLTETRTEQNNNHTKIMHKILSSLQVFTFYKIMIDCPNG